MKKYKPVILTILSGVLLSISLGLYNNFPITYPDTAPYLSSGIFNQLPNNRPIFYGWFLRHTHMMDNLFFCLFAQGILSSIVLYLFFHYFSRYQNKSIHFLLSIFILCCFTGYSFFVSYLIPDIFTPILLITLACIFFADFKNWHLWILIPICVFATIVHNSHFPIFILCLLMLGGKYVLFNPGAERSYFIRKWLLVFSIFLVSISITFAVNFSFTKRLFLSQNGHVFFISRLHELGILEEFLNKKCASGNYILCSYKDAIPPDFLWDSNSPLYKLGGWDSSTSEYNRMIHDIIWDKLYFKDIAVAAFYSTLEQLGSFEIEPQGRNILAFIGEQFPLQRNIQNISFQNRGNGRLTFDKLNERQNIFVLGSFTILVLLLLFYQHWPGRHKQLVVYFLWALVFNAFVCSTFSTVCTRFQGRVIFLIPLVLLLILPSIDFKSFLFFPVKESN